MCGVYHNAAIPKASVLGLWEKHACGSNIRSRLGSLLRAAREFGESRKLGVASEASDVERECPRPRALLPTPGTESKGAEKNININ